MKYVWLLALSLAFTTSAVWTPPLQAQEAKEAEKKEEKAESKEDKAKSEENSEEKKEEAKKDDAKKEEAKKPEKKSHTVKEEELEISFEATGTFVARNMSEVKLKPEAWASWKIEHVVPHGKKVSKGEVLVRFESKDLREALEELELENRLGELALIKADADLPRIEKAMKMAFGQAERNIEEARRDYKHYTETDRERMEQQLDLRMKSSEQQVENIREELRQLEKMYKSDDLTEETEEIVLARQRNQLEQAEFFLESSRISYERSKEYALPEADIAQKEALEMMEMAFDRAKTSLETDLARVRYEHEKAKRSRKKSLEKHADLTKDLGLLEIKSPADGVVYYGECVDGNWANTASLINKLKPEQNATPNSVLMTIVDTGELYLTSSVGETNRPGVEKGQTCVVTPTADTSVKLAGKVADVSNIPVAQAKFSLEIDINEQEFPEWLVPGMTGKAKVVTYKADKAITVPKAAVHTDEKDKEKKFVWLMKDDKATKRTVTVGKAKGDTLEITKGLKGGDVVSLEDEAKKKEEEKKAADKEKSPSDDKEKEKKKEAKEDKDAKEKKAEKKKDKDEQDDKDEESEEEGDDEEEKSESDED